VMESSFRRLLLFKSVLTSGGKAGVDGVKFPLLNYKLIFTAN
jgi:hypothetical protein